VGVTAVGVAGEKGSPETLVRGREMLVCLMILFLRLVAVEKLYCCAAVTNRMHCHRERRWPRLPCPRIECELSSPE
jgi:hypothetical protein